MTAALALLTGREFFIGFLVGGAVFGFGVLAICRAKMWDAGYHAGWLDRETDDAERKRRIHNW